MNSSEKTRHLVIDIETDSLDIGSANVVIFGMYDIEKDSYFIVPYDKKDANKFMNFIKNYDWIITFNGKSFDIPIIQNNGVTSDKFKYNHIDLFEIIKYKRNTMMVRDGFQRFSLREIIKVLKLDDVGKGNIDYKIFQEKSWTDEEKKDIIKYCKIDLKLTMKLWLYMLDRFDGFKHFIPEKDVLRYKHVTLSAGAYAYKAICYMTGIPEEYEDLDDNHESFTGAFVADPSTDNETGIILDLDFASLYPWINIQGNLFSHSCDCCTKEEKWHGGDFFTEVRGYYCHKKLGTVEECIKKLYMMRKEYKINKDKREEAVKVLINSIYGISGSPRFKNLYSETTASDCTSIGRACIKYARSELDKMGFKVLYSDTDSVYVKVPDGKTVDECISAAKDISIFLANKMNFPHPEHFELKVDEKIRYIQFFGVKKHYLYVTDKGILVVKGLVIKQKNCSMLSKKIFDEYITPEIINNNNCKFFKKKLKKIIYEELKKDIKLAIKKFNIKNIEEYKSETSLQYSIMKKFGPGEHELVRNNKIGIGKDVKYCHVNDIEKLSVYDIDIDTFLSELEPFIKDESNQQKIMDFFI